MNSDYFKTDKYWKEHINKELEEDIWINEYKNYFVGKGNCLDLGCGIGQFSKALLEIGYNVTSADISETALNKVKEFNPNIIKLDMQEKLPFENNTYDLVFANLSIHYFSDNDTKNLMEEIKRILKPNGLFIGAVNDLEGYQARKDTAKEIEHHFWYNKEKLIRLFDEVDLNKYLLPFDILKLEKKETIRFNHKKNYWIFICKK